MLSFYFSLFIILLFQTCVGLDPKFEACEPKSCGCGPNISYPFYIPETQESYCGQPGFELGCAPNGFPILTLPETIYIIHEIFYNDHYLRVSNSAFPEQNMSSCIALTRELKLDKSRFRVAPDQRDLYLLYGCDLSALPERVREGRIGCSEGNETTSVVGLGIEDQDFGLAWDNCKGDKVIATVEDVKGGVREALRGGFWLIWDATNCGKCNNSGGRCGFDTDPLTYAFRCYCPDGPRAEMCDAMSKTTVHKLTVIATTVLSKSIFTTHAATIMCSVVRLSFRCGGLDSHWHQPTTSRTTMS